jgi:hypothetical protein
VNSCVHQGYKHGGKEKKNIRTRAINDAEKDDGYKS